MEEEEGMFLSKLSTETRDVMNSSCQNDLFKLLCFQWYTKDAGVVTAALRRQLHGVKFLRTM